MSSAFGECSVMQEINKTEEAIKNCYSRVEKLENLLRSEQMPEPKRNTVKKELAEVRKLLATNQEQLSKLHKHNRKTFAFAAALCFVVFTVYALYILVNGRDF